MCAQVAILTEHHFGNERCDCAMQTKNPFLDDMAQLMTNAMGAAQGVGDEMQAMMRAQIERLVADMDLVGRDEFEAMKELATNAKAESEDLKERVAALEARLNGDTGSI